MPQLAIYDGVNHPSAATVLADGLVGGLLYGGTPNSGKNFTAAQYADFKAHGLLTPFAYENLATDMSGGATAGVAHASALISDLRAKHVAETEPVFPTVDEHVSVADLPLAVEYQRAFFNTVVKTGWLGRIGTYGFPELLNAVHADGCAEFYFGAGSRASQPAFVNIWQDNTQTVVVGGAHDDKDWILIPLPVARPLPTPAPTEGTDMQLTDPIPSNPAPGTVGFVLRDMQRGVTGVNTAGTMALGILMADDDIAEIATAVSNLANAVTALQSQLVASAAEIAAIKAKLGA